MNPCMYAQIELLASFIYLSVIELNKHNDKILEIDVRYEPSAVCSDRAACKWLLHRERQHASRSRKRTRP